MALKPLIAGSLYQSVSLKPVLAGRYARAGGVFRELVGGLYFSSSSGSSSDTSLSTFTVEGQNATDGGSVNLDSTCIGASIIATSTAFVTTGAGASLRSNFTGTVGYAFDLTEEITVTHLGRWVASGNSQTHAIGIWDSGGNLLGSVTVDTSGAPVGYLYVALGSPIVLPVDTDYRVGSHEVSLGDQWYDEFILSSTGVGAVTGAAYDDGVALDWPSGDATALKGYVPVNFKYLGRALSIVTTPTDPDATVGTKTLTPSALVAGSNELEFNVTAQDGVTVQPYNVTLFTPITVDLDSSNFAFGGYVGIIVDPSQYFASNQYLEFVTTAGLIEVKPVSGVWDYYIDGVLGGSITGDDTFQQILDTTNGTRTIRLAVQANNAAYYFRTSGLRLTGDEAVSKPANGGVAYDARGNSFIAADGGWDTAAAGTGGYGTTCFQTYDYGGGSLRFQGAGTTVKVWILNNTRESVPFFAILYADGVEVDRFITATTDKYIWADFATDDSSTHEYEVRILTRYFNVIQAVALITSGGGDGLDTGYSPPARNQILGLGDSITAGTDPSLSADDRASMFGLQVALDQELGYVNLALPGYTVANVITQTTGIAPSSVISSVTDIDVMIGTNDISVGTPTSDYIGYYGTIISNLRSGFPSAKIRMIGVTPRTTDASEVTTLNGYMSDAVDDAADADCIFIDTSSIGINPTAGQDTTDGIHLNASGYAKVASAVLATYP